MTLQPLDYRSSPSPRKWPWRLLISSALLVIVTSILPFIGQREEFLWIDSISGSTKQETAWWFGYSAKPAITRSPLEVKYRQLGIDWQPNWANVRDASLNTFGMNIARACGTAPAIYNLAGEKNVQAAFIAASSDEEIREFFNIMSSGTRDQQKTAAEAAADKGLDALTMPRAH